VHSEDDLLYKLDNIKRVCAYLAVAGNENVDWRAMMSRRYYTDAPIGTDLIRMDESLRPLTWPQAETASDLVEVSVLLRS